MAEYEAGGIVNQSESLSVDSINDREEERSIGILQLFGNSLIVELMCSYVSLLADLQNLRLVNHTFQSVATKRLRRVHRVILLNSESRIQSLVDLAKSRDALNLTPFPLIDFQLSLTPSLETLEAFGRTVGPHIRNYTFQLRLRFKVEHPAKKLVTLLSHSPELTMLMLFSNLELLLTTDEVNRLPSVFNNLKTLEFSSSDPKRKRGIESENYFPLADVLFIRSPELKNLSISPRSYTLHHHPHSSRILRLLVQSCPRNLERFHLETKPCFIESRQEVVHNNVTFPGLSILRYVLKGERARNMIRSVCTWLETQTNTLTHLSLDIFSYRDQAQGSFEFPELHALKKLKLTFPDQQNLSASPYSWHILPFVGNPFPVLQKLCLEHYREEFALFGPCSMPSVKILHLRFQSSPISDPSWSTTFPNLTRLHIEFDPDLPEVFRSTLSYILTHLTRLQHLDLDMAPNENEMFVIRIPDYAWSCWNLLTGGALQFRELDLIFSAQGFVGNVGATEDHVNGIYTIPSLSNMKTLKTLRIFPRLRSNLNAIFYMSYAGLLIPLQKLVLSSLKRDNGPQLTEDERNAYKEGFLNIHKDVLVLEPTELIENEEIKTFTFPDQGWTIYM